MSEESIFSEDEEPAIRNAAEAKRNVRVKDEAARERRRGDAIWRSVLSGPLGRRQLYDILTVSGALRRRYAFGQVDDATRWMGAGQQQFGFDLFLLWLRIDPEATLEMLRENHPTMIKPARKKRTIYDPWRDEDYDPWRDEDENEGA